MSFLVVLLAHRRTWRGHPHAHISLLKCHWETQPVISRPFPNQALYSVLERFQWVAACKSVSDRFACQHKRSLSCVCAQDFGQHGSAVDRTQDCQTNSEGGNVTTVSRVSQSNGVTFLLSNIVLHSTLSKHVKTAWPRDFQGVVAHDWFTQMALEFFVDLFWNMNNPRLNRCAPLTSKSCGLQILRVSLKKAAQTLFVFLSEKKTKLCILLNYHGSSCLAGYWLGRYNLRGVTVIVLNLWLVNRRLFRV